MYPSDVHCEIDGAEERKCAERKLRLAEITTSGRGPGCTHGARAAEEEGEKEIRVCMDTACMPCCFLCTAMSRPSGMLWQERKAGGANGRRVIWRGGTREIGNAGESGISADLGRLFCSESSRSGRLWAYPALECSRLA